MSKRNRGPIRPANICIFKEETDQEDHVGITKEHLWSGWMSEFFPRTEYQNLNGHRHRYTNFDHSTEGVVEVFTSGSLHRGAIASRKLRLVCATCNNGWMSVVETHTKDIFGKLINNGNVNLNAEQQLELCRWAVLKSIIAEFTDIPNMAISPDDRIYFKNKLTPPPGWKIWVGNYLGSDIHGPQRYSHTGARAAQSRDALVLGKNIQTSTFVIGELLLHCVSNKSDLVEISRPSPTLVQIWPPKVDALQWPLPLPIGDNEADAICYYLQRWGIQSAEAEVAVIKTGASVFM